MHVSNKFHPGELAVQERVSAPQAIHRYADASLRDHLVEQHAEFFAQLPFVVLAAADAGGRPWCSIVWGEPGFVRAADQSSLTVSFAASHGDPLLSHLHPGSQVGILGIEFHSKRRNRLNGRLLSTPNERQLLVAVQQSYGNCPKYITRRVVRAARARAPGSIEQGNRLTSKMRSLIEQADTFFIASAYSGASPASGFDASHRGGSRGFVEIDSETQLTFPDYSGNNLFNTLGNLVEDARAGLLFLDFEQGTLLHLTGQVVIDWDSPRVATFAGAKRLLVFQLDATELDAVVLREAAVLREAVLPLTFA